MPRHPKPPRIRQRHYLREWRLKKGLTQDQLASRMHITGRHLSKIENLKKPYNQDIIEMAAEAMGITVADIMIRNPLDETAPWSLDVKYAIADEKTKNIVDAALERPKKTGT